MAEKQVRVTQVKSSIGSKPKAKGTSLLGKFADLKTMMPKAKKK